MKFSPHLGTKLYGVGLLLALGLTAGVAGAAGVAPRPPLESYRVGCQYFDPQYLRTEDRQHLGVDLPADEGAIVYAPVSGRIVVNNTGNSVAIDQSYLVIQDTNSAMQHVLGHVRSTLSVGRTVARGDRVATVGRWPGNSHVHWGINNLSVAQATGVSSRSGWGGGNWGWGRAPSNATRMNASNRGWIDAGQLVVGRSRCV